MRISLVIILLLWCALAQAQDESLVTQSGTRGNDAQGHWREKAVSEKPLLVLQGLGKSDPSVPIAISPNGHWIVSLYITVPFSQSFLLV